MRHIVSYGKKVDDDVNNEQNQFFKEELRRI